MPANQGRCTRPAFLTMQGGPQHAVIEAHLAVAVGQSCRAAGRFTATFNEPGIGESGTPLWSSYRGGYPAAVQLQQVVDRCLQPPLRARRAPPSSLEPAKPAVELVLREHRLDRRFAVLVELAAVVA
jgi:hypothetical protein